MAVLGDQQSGLSQTAFISMGRRIKGASRPEQDKRPMGGARALVVGIRPVTGGIPCHLPCDPGVDHVRQPAAGANRSAQVLPICRIRRLRVVISEAGLLLGDPLPIQAGHG